MKITIETNVRISSQDATHRVTIESPFDEMSLPDLIEILIKPALLAMQYHPDCVDRITYEEENPYTP